MLNMFFMFDSISFLIKLLSDCSGHVSKRILEFNSWFAKSQMPIRTCQGANCNSQTQIATKTNCSYQAANSESQRQSWKCNVANANSQMPSRHTLSPSHPRSPPLHPSHFPSHSDHPIHPPLPNKKNSACLLVA